VPGGRQVRAAHSHVDVELGVVHAQELPHLAVPLAAGGPQALKVGEAQDAVQVPQGSKKRGCSSLVARYRVLPTGANWGSFSRRLRRGGGGATQSQVTRHK